MNTDTKKIFEEFIERVEEIQKYSYFNNPSSIVGGEIRKEGDKFIVNFHQPGNEETAAILLHIRLFYGNDDFSIRSLAKLLEDPSISESWKKEFIWLRKVLNTQFDIVVAERNGERLTYRDIFKMFLFGKIGHRKSKDAAYKMHEEWVRNQKDLDILYNMFQETIVWFLNTVINIGKICEEELHRQ